MATYKEQIREIWKQYRKEVSAKPAELRDVAAWAIKKRLWQPQPADLSASLAKDLAEALRDETRIDSKGRRYRANVPVRIPGKDGTPLFFWADIDAPETPRAHVENNIQQERRSIVSDCYALAMKVEHFNDQNPNEKPLQVVFDFTDDVEELKIARGIEDDDKAA